MSHANTYLTSSDERSRPELRVLHATDDISFDDLLPAQPTEELTPAPAPRRARTGLLVAGALGGGMMVGGGAVAALALVGTGVLGLALVGAGAAAWLLMASPELEPEVEAAPVVADVALEEAPVEAAAPAAPVASTARSTEPVAAAPVAAEPAPVASSTPAAPAPVAATTAPVAPSGPMTVKFFTTSPAAEVVVDGVSLGKTPLKTEITAGSHQVHIELGKASGDFSITAGSTDRWCFDVKGKKVVETGC